MQKIRLVFHKGKVEATAEGYIGGACKEPIHAVLEKLGGKVEKEEVTAEGCLPDEQLAAGTSYEAVV